MMALPFLVRSCLLHVSRAARATALTSVTGIGSQRCFSSVTAGLRGAFSRVCALHPPVPSPLLGQCQKLTHVQSTCGMKTKTALKRRCKDCFFVRRRGRLFVYCKTHPRHKQRQG